MREHLVELNRAKSEISNQTANLVEAVLFMIPSEPMKPYQLRDLFQNEWNKTYNENKSSKEAWNLIRLAMRKGMIGRCANGLIYPRDGKDI